MIQEPIILGQNTPFPLKGMLTLPDNLFAPVPALGWFTAPAAATWMKRSEN